MSPNKYKNVINEFMKGWYENAINEQKQFLSWKAFFEDNPFSFLNSLPYRFFPEPYIGDPLSKKLEAVFINLNPGEGGDMQDVFDSSQNNINRLFEGKKFDYYKTIREFINRNETFFKSSNWKKFEKSNKFTTNSSLKAKIKKLKKINSVLSNSKALPVLCDTYAWWHDNRLMWLKETLSLKKVPRLDEIIGVEMNPWHSTNFNKTGNTVVQIWKYVLLPAIHMSAKIRLGPLNNGKNSIVILRGSAFKDIFTREVIQKLNITNSVLSQSVKDYIPIENFDGWYQWTFVDPTSKHKCIFLIYTKQGQRDMKLGRQKNLSSLFESLLNKN